MKWILAVVLIYSVASLVTTTTHEQACHNWAKWWKVISGRD